MLFAGVALCPWQPVPAQATGATPTLGTIERIDPRFDQLVPRDARVERIAEGFDWSEGPVWDKKGKYLLFSDVPQNTVFKWQEGKVSVFLKPSGYTGKTPRGGEPGSNGLLMDSQGRLILCQHGDRRVARLKTAASLQHLPINTWASASTVPTMASSSRTATFISPTRPTAYSV